MEKNRPKDGEKDGKVTPIIPFQHIPDSLSKMDFEILFRTTEIRVIHMREKGFFFS